MRLVIDIARLIISLLKFCLVMMMLQNCVKIRANIKKIEHSFKNYRIIFSFGLGFLLTLSQWEQGK